ncbi:MAG: c-type cytochrome [Planctomycetota bacterium]|jgi:putative heme-binding domain-containing protein
MSHDWRQSDTAPLIRLVAVSSCLVVVVLLAVIAKLGLAGRLLSLGQPERSPSDALASLAAELTASPDATLAGLAGGDPDRALQTLPGFAVELVYRVPQSQGSWVCLTVDGKGRLIASAQEGGLYRIAPPAIGADPSATTVEAIDSAVGAAQGLLCLESDLYCVVAAPRAEGEGLYRLRDTDGDDVYDELRLLRRLGYGGEHGPHAVVAGPDGLLYVVAGNHTPIPDPERSVVPRHWGEDHLLPRLWDASGHAVGILAPGGWICRTDRDGSTWELFAVGFRNPYDIAFNRDGELFTFDADMEWDMGAPWYRPTRINHVVSGADFGWRSGTAKWPAHYGDSLPGILDIGPGSPTGVCFGYGSGFPQPYQDAFYALDWTFGTVYAIHLYADGATYRAVPEPFVTGRPFPVADVVVNPNDGAMYFVVGGRGAESAIYRVRFVGGVPEGARADLTHDDGRSAAVRQRRRRLESLHRIGDAQEIVDEAWPSLASRDRFLAHAARVALEHQPPASWVDRVFREQVVRAKLNAMLAAARCADGISQSAMIRELESIRWERLEPDERFLWLRCWKLCFIRLGAPAPELARRLATGFEGLYPTEDDLANRELCDLLVYLGSPRVVSRTIPLMERADRSATSTLPDPELLARNDTFGKAILKMAAAMPQQQQVHYALALSYAENGWTPDLRSRYIGWFESAGRTTGGHSFAGFLERIRANALERVPAAERAQYDGVAAAFEPYRLDDLPVPRGPGRAWTVDELVDLAASRMANRDFQNGERMYQAAMCARCHRFAGTGVLAGPDLTAVATRYTMRDLIESIVEPSRVVSDQYEQTEFVLDDGSVVIGRVIERDERAVRVMPTLLFRESRIEIPIGKIESESRSKLSPMMPTLLDRLNADEVMDLLAYLLAEGDERNPVFAAAPR